jgi:hypothetical protein
MVLAPFKLDDNQAVFNDICAYAAAHTAGQLDLRFQEHS